MSTQNTYQPQSVTAPSQILRELLEEKSMGSKELAVKTGKPEKTISAVLNDKSSITPEMAVLFEKVLKVPARFWLEIQRNYDEYKARQGYQKNIEEAQDWAREFPYAEMAKRGWVPKTRKAAEKAEYLFDFFGVASQKGFEQVYFEQKTPVAFRISLKKQKNALAIAAWLRQGELQASEIEVGEYDAKKLEKLLPEFKRIMVEQAGDFFAQLQSLCAEAGVKLVFTPNLPKLSIHGATRWLGDTPLVQMTGRYNRNDIFWFTFFHEIAHILMHGKKYISVENIAVQGENEEYEQEANKFASDWMLTKEQEAEVLSREELFASDIEEMN